MVIVASGRSRRPLMGDRRGSSSPVWLWLWLWLLLWRGQQRCWINAAPAAAVVRAVLRRRHALSTGNALKHRPFGRSVAFGPYVAVGSRSVERPSNHREGRSMTARHDYAAIRANIRKLVDDVVRPNAERLDRDAAFPSENLAALAREGWNSVLFPEELGGLGLDHVAFTIATEEIASVDASTALIYVMHVSATQTIFLFGSDDQKERWVKGSRAGKIGTFSTSERATGGHFWYNVSQAKRRGQDYVVDLEKSFTTSSGHADFYVLTTQTPGAAKPSDVTWFIVDGKQKGISSGKWEALGVRANHSGSLRVDNVVVPERDRLGREGQGKEIMFDGGSPSYLLGLGAVWHGVARGALAEATRYATSHRTPRLRPPARGLPGPAARARHVEGPGRGLAALAGIARRDARSIADREQASGRSAPPARRVQGPGVGSRRPRDPRRPRYQRRLRLQAGDARAALPRRARRSRDGTLQQHRARVAWQEPRRFAAGTVGSRRRVSPARTTRVTTPAVHRRLE